MPHALREPESEFLALADRSTDRFAVPYVALLKAIVSQDPSAIRRARERCARMIGETMALADLYGRRRIILETRHYAQEAQFAATPIVPHVTYADAISDLVSRTPELAETAEEVSMLYNSGHAFALVKSSEETLTRAIQEFIGSALEQGQPAPKALTQVQGLGNFTRSYANSVYRTNLTTAYTAGRFQQARDPDVKRVLPAMERWEIMDSATRRGRKEDHGENHAACHGLIMRSDDPRWSFYAPPAGYGCRGGVRMVPVPELRRRGLYRESGEVRPYFPAGIERYKPHPNFGHKRPDLLIYGGA